MRRGFQPPLSGRVGNYFKDSCGCFIRAKYGHVSRPGCRKPLQNTLTWTACVDHADEGVYGEVFFAGVESSAFIESDTDKLIDIGLSYIPSDCAVAKAVRLMRKAYRDKLSWQEARKLLFKEVPGSFFRLLDG